MSATLRHNIGATVFAAVNVTVPGVFDPFIPKDVQIHAGRSNPRWEAVGFSIKLPSQAGDAYRLMEACFRAYILPSPVTPAKGALLLGKKIAASLGVPYAGDGLPGEEGLAAALKANPHDLSAWAVYADLLQERGCWRGDLIRGWLGKKAIQVKYGIPLIARRNAMGKTWE